LKVGYNDRECEVTETHLRQLELVPENKNDREFIDELCDKVDTGFKGFNKWMVWDGDCEFDGKQELGTKFTILNKEVDDE